MLEEGFTPGHGVHHWHSIDTLNSGLVAPQQSPTATNWPAAYIAYIPLMVRDHVVVKKLWIACGSGDTGNIDIGLYDASGIRLVSSGSTAHPAAATEFVYDCTDTPISPGIYHFAFVAIASASIYRVIISQENAYGVWYENTSPLPSTATWLGGNVLGAMPVGGILINTVVS